MIEPIKNNINQNVKTHKWDDWEKEDLKRELKERIKSERKKVSTKLRKQKQINISEYTLRDRIWKITKFYRYQKLRMIL